ncbi:class I SAM-dependent methyltransferase [Kordiimonas aestuarii]|uniref:class I SAM-dependent methyltransferase n=1 Tax=Kordiimonas aestuarii TaxID=1005925 RepID=UPI0021D09C59|nr:class I SAM-dependent methyltransferase [Kordiimonas aestuarii]
MSEMYEPSLQTLVDIAAEHGIPPHVHFTQWHVMADAQFDALLTIGLKPEHALLDMGCGMGRLATKTVQYLAAGHYAGIDGDEIYIGICRHLLEPVNKPFQLLFNRDFEFERFGMMFDYGIAQSVFTHLSDAQVTLCIKNLKAVMQKGARFLFTYIPQTLPIGFVYEGSYPMLHPTHQDAGFFAAQAENHGIKFQDLDIPHPSQRWAELVF